MALCWPFSCSLSLFFKKFAWFFFVLTCFLFQGFAKNLHGVVGWFFEWWVIIIMVVVVVVVVDDAL